MTATAPLQPHPHMWLVQFVPLAQAAEIAALQPLLYGCRHLVLVGDPQQLPATLFSAAAKASLLERSLFERLAQAGTPVKVGQAALTCTWSDV